MANSYWNFATRMVAGTLAKAADVNTNLDGVAAGFTLVETAIDAISYTVADEAADTTTFVLFSADATGVLAPLSNAALTFDAATGTLGATLLTGDLTGDLTGNVTGNASGTALTVTQAAQPAITSVGTLTSLAVTGEVTGLGFTGTLDGVLGGGTPAAATVTTLSASVDQVSTKAGYFYDNVANRTAALVHMHQDHATHGGANAPVLQVTQDSIAAGVAIAHGGASGNALTVQANSSDPMAYLIQSGAGVALRVTGDAQFDNDITLPALGKLYLDGGSNTYIYEGAADQIYFALGGAVEAFITTTIVQFDAPTFDIGDGNDVNVVLNLDSSANASATQTINFDTKAFVKFDDAIDTLTADCDGSIVLASANTTALTLDATQNATFAGAVDVNGDITTDADGTDSIGATAKRFLKGWFDSLTVTGDVGAATITTSGIVSVDDTTDSTSGTTGSIHTDGGLGVAKDIATDANLIVGGGQIVFPATAVPSANLNTLDDYQEGEWTPTVTAASGTITLNTVVDTLGYTKIGQVVYVQGRISVASVTGPPAGAVKITNMPYGVRLMTDQADVMACPVMATNMVPVAHSYVRGTFNGDNLEIIELDSTAIGAEVQALTTFTFNFFYFTDE